MDGDALAELAARLRAWFGENIASLDLERVSRELRRLDAEAMAAARQRDALEAERRSLLVMWLLRAPTEHVDAVMRLVRELEGDQG